MPKRKSTFELSEWFLKEFNKTKRPDVHFDEFRTKRIAQFYSVTFGFWVEGKEDIKVETTITKFTQNELEHRVIAFFS